MTIGRAVPAARLEMTASSNAPPTAGRADQHGRPDPLDRLDQARNSAEKPYPVKASAGQREPSLGRHRGPRAGRGPARANRRARWPAGRRPRPARPRASPDGAGARCRCPPRPRRRARHAPRQARPEAAQAGQHARDHDGGGPLDVVVERRHAVPVAVEDAQRVVLLEVLPLDDAVRPDLRDALDERLDERVVGRAPQTRRPMADVQRILEEGRIVGPDVERDRQRDGRVDPARRVQGELADRDGHPAGALIAQAEDPLVVGDDDEPDVLVRALAEELRDPVAVGRRDPRPARPADDVAELLARPPDGRRVDDRQELLEVLGDASGRTASRCDPGARPARCSARAGRPCGAGARARARSARRWSGRDPAGAREAGTRRVPRR